MIYVLQDGQLLENGRHEDLLEQAGLYASLWRVQTGANLDLHHEREPVF